MPKKPKKKVIKERIILKKRSTLTGLISFPLLILSLIVIISVSTLLLYRYHQVTKSVRTESEMKSQLVVHNDRLWKRIRPSEAEALNKAGEEEHVHFEFYNSLPNMQALTEEQKFIVSEHLSSAKMVVNADELEKEFSTRLQQTPPLAKTYKKGKD